MVKICISKATILFFFSTNKKKKKTNQPVKTMESKKVDYTELEFEHGDELLLA